MHDNNPKLETCEACMSCWYSLHAEINSSEDTTGQNGWPQSLK